jgi:uncharacterized protein YcfJ
MRKSILALLLCGSLVPARAQLFSSESMGAAMLGGLAGGIIGHNNGRKTAEGIGIGAGAGLLLGALAHQSRTDRGYSAPYYVSSAPGYPATVVYATPRPNYAMTGVALGGVAGGIIGHNNGRRTAEGIAIGAGAGLLLGGFAEGEARRRESYMQAAPVYVAAPMMESSENMAVPATAPSEAPQSSSVNKVYSAPSSMSGANALFGR